MSSLTLTVPIGDRVIPIGFDMQAWEELDEEYPAFDIETYIESMKERGGVKKYVTLLRICCNCGLRKAGEKPDITDDYIMEHSELPMQNALAKTLLMLVSMSFLMQAKPLENSDEIDVTLEEIKKKDESAKRPTGQSARTGGTRGVATGTAGE